MFGYGENTINHFMKKFSVIFIFLAFSFQLFSQSEWKLIEKTNLQDKNGDNVISGTISSGFVFKTWPGGDYYIAGPLTLDVVVAVLPEAKIYYNGLEYKLVIEDFEEPVYCKKLKKN